MLISFRGGHEHAKRAGAELAEEPLLNHGTSLCQGRSRRFLLFVEVFRMFL